MRSDNGLGETETVKQTNTQSKQLRGVGSIRQAPAAKGIRPFSAPDANRFGLVRAVHPRQPVAAQAAALARTRART